MIRFWRSLEKCGLSPRMRGYPIHRRMPSASSGSIPADAGLPELDEGEGTTTKVYPRGCGATKNRFIGEVEG